MLNPVETRFSEDTKKNWSVISIICICSTFNSFFSATGGAFTTNFRLAQIGQLNFRVYEKNTKSASSFRNRVRKCNTHNITSLIVHLMAVPAEQN